MLYDNNNYTVYMHVNKYNDKKYIGITSRKPEDRWANGNGYYRNNHFHRAILKYGWNDGFCHFILKQNLSKHDAVIMERLLIKFYDTTNSSKGYNHGLGGEGVDSMSDETRAKISKSHIGIKPSAETKEKLSKAKSGKNNPNYGKQMLPHVKEALFKGFSNYTYTEEQRNKFIEARGYNVIQYSLDGKYVNWYKSSGDAARKNNMSNSGIKACCEFKIKKNNNYIWRYENDKYIIGKNLPADEVYKSSNMIEELTLDGDFIRYWNSCTEASKTKHIDRHDISDCCKGKKMSAGGSKWRKVISN